jgi:hypothetical protein
MLVVRCLLRCPNRWCAPLSGEGSSLEPKVPFFSISTSGLRDVPMSAKLWVTRVKGWGLCVTAYSLSVHDHATPHSRVSRRCWCDAMDSVVGTRPHSEWSILAGMLGDGKVFQATGGVDDSATHNQNSNFRRSRGELRSPDEVVVCGGGEVGWTLRPSGTPQTNFFSLAHVLCENVGVVETHWACLRSICVSRILVP